MNLRWVGPLLKLFGTNWITLFGTNLTTISGLIIVAFLLLGVLGVVDSPYVAIMALMVLPGIFLFGLLLIPIGLYWERKKKKDGAPDRAERRLRYPIINLNKPRVRRVTLGVVILTTVNLLLISTVSYEAVAYMETTEFCGQICHTVMDPEFAAYLNSSHSKVKCVECHIGPGAPWFVRSKLSGLGQVIAVTFDTFERPIPTPVENLRPSQDTCEQCHWPGRFTGDKIKVITRYSEDETNTPLKTVLALHIGGGEREEGIHSWHIDPDKQTFYVAKDERRHEIAWIQVKEGDQITEYTLDGEDVDVDSLEPGAIRQMDCIDCHNRPTHVFKLPAEAMDESIYSGRISQSIPYIKKAGVEILTEVGNSLGTPEEVVQRLRAYYQENHSDFYSSEKQAVEQAVREIEAIYRRNVAPDMRLTWGTYPNNIGHQNFPGCFRCHDSEHESSDGRLIEQDCETCHTILAWDEENPEILQQLGLEQ